jgi:superfamily II DNA/RNA helicase
MPTTIDAIQAAIAEALTPGFRGRLLARGQARALIWRDGVLPPNAPAFSPLLSYDLHSYAYSLIIQGLRLRELGGDAAVAGRAFEQAANALEAATIKGPPNDREQAFQFFVTAAAYHLAGYSARAYSVLAAIHGAENFSPLERGLSYLITRELERLDAYTYEILQSGTGQDAAIAARFAERLDGQDVDEGYDDEETLLDGVDAALTEVFFKAIATVLLAFERGDRQLLGTARELLQQGVGACEELNLVPQWWAFKLGYHLVADLWDSSFHERLPRAPAGGGAADWPMLRDVFIASLYRRRKAEIDLWPSQRDAARRAVDQADDLVVSLPTSAGKTRIAELCILRTLAAGRRVVFVTPLRALSAQTETSLQRTFGPLGKTISALYGSAGISGLDEDAMRTHNIVVSTPEKLDFALRNDPSLLDDVGLLVFDEGHMIGLNEREVRYEVQIQRLLRREDAADRRIVCLSAILPEGDQLEDFAAWLRRDNPGGIVKSQWRPTRLQFGEVVWNGQSARLNIRVSEERPFVPRYLTGLVPPIGKRKKIFPNDLGELCLATAWRLVADGQSVLIFCPVRAHVEPFADRILDLNKRGALASLLNVPLGELDTAITLGAEWLGPDHPILACLKLGIAIHHGALPTAYRKEIERLLQRGILKVTISSPTLAQGLNLSATVVIMHSLHRAKELIKTSEFKNVIGRAGRAYVDVEGLVLYPIFDRPAQRVAQWEALIADAANRELESGLVRLVISLLQRMMKVHPGNFDQMIEYVMNNANAWDFPVLPGEDADARDAAREEWSNHLTSLDIAILSLVGENDIPDAEVPAALDAVLQSSLWQRRLARRDEGRRNFIRAGLEARARYVWHNSDHARRKGYFLAGIGLTTGHALDAAAAELNGLLVDINSFLLNDQLENAIASTTALAERVFEIPPFKPDRRPDNWRDILAVWMRGLPLAPVAAGQEADTLQFVEGGLVYRLPWAMEAIRVRGISHHDAVGDWGAHLEDFDLTYAVPAVETGTTNRSAAILIQAGFSSRIAAIKAVADGLGTFQGAAGLQQWLRSDLVSALEGDPAWPTAETRKMWDFFKDNFARRAGSNWREQSFWAQVDWVAGQRPLAGSPIKVLHIAGQAAMFSPQGVRVGTVLSPLNQGRRGLVKAVVANEPDRINITYLGPEDLWVVN